MDAEWQAWGTQIDAFPLDSRNYGLRAQTYRMVINGGFDDNLGSWTVSVCTDADVLIEIWRKAS